jgi:hypothetical protein
MPTLKDIYKAKGFTDADLAAVAPLLEDAKFASVLDEELGRLSSENASYKTENEKWATWHQTEGKAALELYEKDAVDAKADAASLRERLRLAEEAGFAPRRTEPATPAAPASTEAFDPKKHNLVTREDVNNFAEMEGRAIAMSADLIEEYRYLTGGKSIIDYTATTSNGRTLKGMSALRQEAMAAKQPLDQYVAKKFDFEGKRTAIADAQKKAAEDAIRADERAKTIQQYGQPGAAPMMPSREPFIPRPREGNEGKQPWERGTEQERTAKRINTAMRSQLGSVQ